MNDFSWLEECQHEMDGKIFSLQDAQDGKCSYSDIGKTRCVKCCLLMHLNQCKHESDGFRYIQDENKDELFYLYQSPIPLTQAFYTKCTKCGELYK